MVSVIKPLSGYVGRTSLVNFIDEPMRTISQIGNGIKIMSVGKFDGSVNKVGNISLFLFTKTSITTNVKSRIKNNIKCAISFEVINKVNIVIIRGKLLFSDVTDDFCDDLINLFKVGLSVRFIFNSTCFGDFILIYKNDVNNNIFEILQSSYNVCSTDKQNIVWYFNYLRGYSEE